MSEINVEWLCTFERHILSGYVHFNDNHWVVMYI